MKTIYSIGLSTMLLLTACSKKDSISSDSSSSSSSADTSVTAAAYGVTFKNNGTSVFLKLAAPGKTSVAVIGDFNNWTASSAYQMTKSSDGQFWYITLDGLTPATEYAYQFLVDSTIRVADPYAEKILDPSNDSYISSSVYPNLKVYPTGKTTEIVSTFQYGQDSYTWKSSSFSRPAKSNLVIYEMLVRDFVSTHSYSEVTDSLAYLKKLGINAIELLPVNEFEGNSSWGYNTNFLFALDKYYGTKNAYKAFVDACHQNGIAVIQDIVIEDQFGSSPMVRMYAQSNGYPSSDNPWFYTANRHPYAVGYQMNHTTALTKKYIKDVLKYWVSEYHIDGYRLDQSKALTPNITTSDASWSAYDADRIAIIKEYNTYLSSIDTSLYMILEHFADNSEQKVLTDAGMIVWTNLNYVANQSTMGWNTDWNLSGLFYNGYGFSQPYNLLSYFESHDEERLQYKNGMYGNASGSYNVKTLSTGLSRDAMAAAFLFSSPGPKMLWQFGERGYDISIDNNGRTGEKSPHWEYMKDANRAALYNVYAQMIAFKKANSVFNSTDFSYSLNDNIKYTISKGSDGVNLFVIGNFDVVAQSATVTLPANGTWYDNLADGSITVANNTYTFTLQPGEYHVYSSAKKLSK